MDIWGLALTVVGFALGISAVWLRVEKVIAAVREVIDVLVALTEALDDKNLTKEEVEKITKEAKQVANAIKAIFRK